MSRAMLIFVLLFSLSSFAGKQVLVVLSSENKITLQNGIVHPTGFFLSELAVPLMGLLANGYEPVFANPKGNKASLDRLSDSAQWFGGDRKLLEQARQLIAKHRGFQRPWKLSDIRRRGVQQFAGVFVPGGHAPMEDLLKDKDLGAILSEFHRLGRPTALICHGPIALLSTLPDAETFASSLATRRVPIQQKWIYNGYRMTSFSTAEERQEEPGQDNVLGGFIRFYPDLALRIAGGHILVGPKWTSHVVRDRELITGRNPMSDKEFTQVFLKALDEQNLAPRYKKILSLAPQLRNRLMKAVLGGAVALYDGTLTAGRVTSILGQPFPLAKGYTTFFIGARLERFPAPSFLRRLDSHMKLVTRLMQPRGLRGYVVVATADFEVAMMNWVSEEGMNKAFQETGSIIPNDGTQFLRPLVWEKF